MLTRCELEGMYQDTGGVEVRRVRATPSGGQQIDRTWGDLERVPADAFEGEAVVWDRVSTLRLPAEAMPGLRVRDELETRAQRENARWRPWRVSRIGEAEKDGDELLLQLAVLE